MLDRLDEFLAIPSVSTKTEHRGDVARCAEWLVSELRRIGLRPSVTRRPGIRSCWPNGADAPSGAPTVLIYGHYDVQPPEPLDLWHSPPFVGTVKDGRLYARGAADDKGQLWIHIKAVEACLMSRGTLPVNIVMLVEGEEEVGSPSLPGFLAAHRERLACDYIVISDTMMFAPGVPNILASMRGLAYFELTARSAATDLHSGQYGGVVANAAADLARVVSTLVDENGRVAMRGFYDDVREPSQARRHELARLSFDERGFASEVGVESLAGEQGYGALERIWLRPHARSTGYAADTPVRARRR